MQPIDDWLTERGWPKPPEPPMAWLEATEMYEDWGDDARASLARRGWLWSFDNDYFDQAFGPEGFYARELRHIFERAGVDVDAVDNYFGHLDGDSGVLVRIRRAGDESCFFKRTDGINDVCHCDLLMCAAASVLEADGADVSLGLLEEDVVVEMSLMPREIANSVLARLDAELWTPDVRGEPCRRITSEEAIGVVGH